MPAAYDHYDYPKYWKGREYEHESEIIAIKDLLDNVPIIKKALDIGCGYGRLVPTYLYRVKKAVLADPSAKLLSQAKKRIAPRDIKKITFIQSKLENLNHKVKASSCDLVLMVRVAHHLTNLDKALYIIHRLLAEKGYLIFEYPNKKHFKAIFQEFSHGNFTFPLDIFSKDIRAARNVKRGTLPFINYHPDIMTEKLNAAGFEIIKTRSVSNIRSSLAKKILPLETLLNLEKRLQPYLAKFYFGPSIIILARKKAV